MSATFITPVDVSPGATAAWTDVDVSASVPAGTTGVILHFVNNQAALNRAIGLRKNGSTDNDIGDLSGAVVGNNIHGWAAIGVDGSRILEIYKQSTDIVVYLVGYFDTDAVFFTNRIDKSIGVINTWTDIDISSDTGADTALFAFWEVSWASGSPIFGFRKNGSTDNRVQGGSRHIWAGVGLDGSEICEMQINGTSADCFLNGYMKAGVTVNTNGLNRSIGSANVYTDLTALGTGAVGGIYEIFGTTKAHDWALRVNGSSEDIFMGSGTTGFAMVEADASGLVEQKISSTAVDCFELGYFFVAPVVLTVTQGVIHVTDQTVDMPLVCGVSPATINASGKDIATAYSPFLVDQASIHLAGQAIGELLNTPITQATIKVGGQTIDFGIPVVVDVSPATIKVGGQNIGLPLSAPITKAGIRVTGQNISIIDSPKMVVSPAAVRVAGQSVTLAALMGVSKAMIQVVPQTIVGAFGSGVTQAVIRVAGQSITQPLSLGVTRALMQLAGQNVAGLVGQAISPAAIHVQGQTIGAALGFQVQRALVQLAGQAINEALVGIVAPASIHVVPQDINLMFSPSLTVDYAAIHVAGQNIGNPAVVAIQKADIHIAGQGFSFDRGLPVTKADIHAIGQAETFAWKALVENALIHITGEGLILGREMEPILFRSTVTLRAFRNTVSVQGGASIVRIPFDKTKIH